MRRRVLGYEKTLELLKEGYELRESALGYSYYMYIEDEIVSVRSDVYTKMLRNNIGLKKRYDGWNRIYYIEGAE